MITNVDRGLELCLLVNLLHYSGSTVHKPVSASNPLQANQRENRAIFCPKALWDSAGLQGCLSRLYKINKVQRKATDESGNSLPR